MKLSSDDLLVIAKTISDLERRETVICRAVDAAIANYGPDSLKTGLALTDLADCYGAQGKKADELAVLDRVSRILADFAKANPDQMQSKTGQTALDGQPIINTSGQLPVL